MPTDMGDKLSGISTTKVRAACLSFPTEVGLGWDKLHPRALARCSDRVLEALIAVFLCAEAAGNWFDAIGVIMIILIPKSDGGRRPIGLFPSAVRLWMLLGCLLLGPGRHKTRCPVCSG